MSDNHPIQTILAASDFSPGAQAAAEWAKDLARLHGAKLVFHHSLAPPPASPMVPEFVPYTPELHEQYRKAAEERLDQLVQAARGESLNAEADLRVGASASTILLAAKELQADLLVTGTRGLTGVKHLLLGSTAERLVQRSICPVLSVHPDCARLEGPVDSVLVPTDFSKDAEHSARVALDVLFRAGSGARIVLLHAFQIPLEYSNLAGSYMSPDLVSQARQQAEDELKGVANELSERGFKVEPVTREGYAPQVIIDEANERNVDLIAIGTHGRSGIAHALLGSTAERVVQHAACPVLTVRRND